MGDNTGTLTCDENFFPLVEEIEFSTSEISGDILNTEFFVPDISFFELQPPPIAQTITENKVC